MRSMCSFAMIVALVPMLLMAGCSRTVADVNPYTAGTPLGDQKLSMWTSSTQSTFNFTPMKGGDGYGWMPVSFQQHDRPLISGLAEGSTIVPNLLMPAAAIKIAFDPATQKYRIDERGKYQHQVSGNISGTVQNEHTHSGSIGHNHNHSGSVDHNVEGWVGHHHWMYWGEGCNK